MLLSIENLKKSYGANLLFEDLNLILNAGDKIGLIGRNGHGKSTLIKILIGAEEADSGNIVISDDYKLGYLSQHLEFKEKRVLAEACLALDKEDEYVDKSYIAKSILQGLGFSEEQFEQNPQELSGGFQVRLNLAKLLISSPNLLLLDEPTNYLDIISTRWLISFLKKWKGEIILVTHDRSFMDSVCNHIAGIHRQNLKKIRGTTVKFYSLVAQEEEIHQKTRENQLKKREETEKFVERFRAKASKAKAVQSRVKALEKEEVLEELESIEDIDFSFKYKNFRGKFLLRAQDLSFAYDGGNLLFKNFDLSVRNGEKIAVIGKNGKGKSTLLKVLAEILESKTGDIEYSSNTSLGYFGQTNIERLDKNKTIEDELIEALPEYNKTVARSIAGAMLFSGDDALKEISVLSGGEKSRVMLGKILAKPANLLLLDEPTHHLDIQSNIALINAIKNFEGASIIVTHDEEFLREIPTKLILFDNNEVTLFEGTYDDFLERIGFSDEEGQVKVKKNEKKLSKKEKRQLAAKKLQNKSEQRKKIKKVENKIFTAEEEIKSLNEKLIEVTKNGFNPEAEKITKDVAVKKKELNKLYEEYESLG